MFSLEVKEGGNARYRKRPKINPGLILSRFNLNTKSQDNDFQFMFYPLFS